MHFAMSKNTSRKMKFIELKLRPLRDRKINFVTTRGKLRAQLVLYKITSRTRDFVRVEIKNYLIVFVTFSNSFASVKLSFYYDW